MTAMQPWKIQAILAAFFAGLTSVLAKSGMKNLGPDVSLALRTCVVFTLVLGNALVVTSAKPLTALHAASPRDLLLLAACYDNSPAEGVWARPADADHEPLARLRLSASAPARRAGCTGSASQLDVW